ncbi:MAG: flagellin [Pseudomonadota bacterium]
MSSILTNTSAMVALQTLKSINMDLGKIQSEISTGKSVGSAKDNASVWAISKVMESDVKAFAGISDSLSRGESTLAVARQGSETITDLLTDVKGKIVAAQEGNDDERAKIQADISALTDQIQSVVSAAQFNGVNLLKGTDDLDILSSLDRGADGTVETNSITVARQDLSTDAGVFGGGGALTVTATDGANSLAGVAGTEFSNAGNTMTIELTDNAAANDVFNFTIAGENVTFTAAGADETVIATALAQAINEKGIEGISATSATGTITLTSTRAFEDVAISADSSNAAQTFSVNGAAAAGDVSGAEIASRSSDVTFNYANGVSEGDSFRVSINGSNYDYVAGKNETFEDVTRGLKTVIDGAAVENISTNVATDANGNFLLQVDNDGADVVFAASGQQGGTATGGLVGLDKIDVTSVDGATAALSNIETMIANSIDSSAAFGSAEGRVVTQSDFISNLTDSLKTGIGALVDADMEEASARLQALQVQQQLGVQSLSIANQAPQSILSLFR